jgi:hypothetical protein
MPPNVGHAPLSCRAACYCLLLWLLAEGRPWQRPAVNVAVWLHTGQASWASTNPGLSPCEVALPSCLPVGKQTATHSVGPLLPRPPLVLLAATWSRRFLRWWTARHTTA